MASCRRPLLHGPPHAGPRRTLDLISKNVMSHANVVAAPADDARPGQTGKEGAGGPAPSRTRDPSRHDPRKRTQKSLKRVTTARTHEQVQMRTHVCKIIHAHAESTRHVAEDAAHGGVMLSQIPEPAAASSVENDVHRSARADGSFELALPAPHVAAMLGTSELGLQRTQKERPLHEHNSTRKHELGQCLFVGVINEFSLVLLHR